MMLLRVAVQTELVSDRFVFPIRDKSASVEWLLSEILRRYHEWHPFKVYEFELSTMNNIKINDSDKNVLLFDLMKINNNKKDEISCNVIESESSKIRRKEDEEKEEELRLERLRIEKEKEEARKRRIYELSSKANCWELDKSKYSQFLNVSLLDEEGGGSIVENTGSLDQWTSIRFISTILPSCKKFMFSVQLLSMPYTTNTWRCCVGVVPVEFKIDADRHWIGSQHSWSYIAGTGGKCYNSGKSQNFGEAYGENDIISILLDFENHTIEFFKNGKSQGIAFKNLKCAVIPAISVTAKGCKIKLLDLLNQQHLPSKYKSLMIKNVEKIRNYIKQNHYYLSSEFELYQTKMWNAKNKKNMLYPRFSSHHYPSSLHFDHSNKSSKQCNIVTNIGSGDKWRIARTFGAYYPCLNDNNNESDDDLCSYQFEILKDGKSTNTWRICIGVIPIDFDSTSDKIWCGAQSSWAYIGGTGGKVFNSSQSTSYGERFTVGDIISVLIDFKNCNIEFFKNNESQGIAFENCKSMKNGVYAAVSMTASNASVKFTSLDFEKSAYLKNIGIQQREILQTVVSEYGNIWDHHKLTTMHSHNKLNIIDKLYVESNWSENTNKNKNDKEEKWHSVASLLPYQTGRRYFEVKLCKLPQTKNSNSWKICVGVVPKSFDFNHSKSKLWIGAQNSWSIICGTGGKCHNSTKSVSFASSPLIEGDVIGVLMDFDNHTLEFYKNRKSLGEAFNNLYGPVYAAVSIVINNAKIQFVPSAEVERTDELFLFK